MPNPTDKYVDADGLEHVLELAKTGFSTPDYPIPSTYELVGYSTTETLTVTSNTGIQSVTIADPTIATVTFLGNTISVTFLKKSGNTVLTITTNGGGKYTSRSCNVNVKGNVKYVSFANGTDQDIVDVVTALDSGDIVRSDLVFWNVGDTRTIEHSAIPATTRLSNETHAAQPIEWMILDNKPIYQLSQQTSGGKTYNDFVIGMKNRMTNKNMMYNEAYYPKPTANGVTVKPWKESARRDWANSVFRNSIPSSIRSIFKLHKIPTQVFTSMTTSSNAKGYTLSSEYVDDYFSYLSVLEFKSPDNANWDDIDYGNQTQLEYLKDSSNRRYNIGYPYSSTDSSSGRKFIFRDIVMPGLSTSAWSQPQLVRLIQDNGSGTPYDVSNNTMNYKAGATGMDCTLFGVV